MTISFSLLFNLYLLIKSQLHVCEKILTRDDSFQCTINRINDAHLSELHESKDLKDFLNFICGEANIR